MTEYVICCTGKGAHGRIEFPRLIRDGAEVREVLSRERPAPWGGGATLEVDGERHAAPARYVDKAESARFDHGDQERWRWKCPACRLDRPLTGDKLRAWMDLTDGVLLDISVLPR